MRIGILGGTGPGGQRARRARLASVGYEVVIGFAVEVPGDGGASTHCSSSGPTSVARVDAGDNDGAAAECDLVVDRHAVGFGGDHGQASSRRQLSGKVVISMANALVRVGHEFQPLVPPRGSVAAHVQAAVPGARVAAAFHHLPAKELGHLGQPIETDVLICSRRPPATEAPSRDRRPRSRLPPARRRRAVERHGRSRRSPPCCCSSTSATRPGSRRKLDRHPRRT